MANLTITDTAVKLVKSIEVFPAPAGEAISAGQYCRFDISTGKWTKGNGSNVLEARLGGIALQTVAAGETVDVLRYGYLEVGSALSALGYDAKVYLSDTDGTLSDSPGTIGRVVATVWPGWGATTADKILRVDCTGDGSAGIGSALINGGAAGDHTVTGIRTTDQIVKVYHISTAASIATMADLTSEFTIDDTNTITNTTTDTTNDQLLVFWNRL